MPGSSGVQPVVQLSQTPGQGTGSAFSFEGTNCSTQLEQVGKKERLPGTVQDRPQTLH